MTFALDTGIFSLLVLGHARVTARRTEDIAAGEDEITIPAMVRTETALGTYRILELSWTATDHFDRLLTNKKHKKNGRPDLLIACIALAHNATLVTRSTKDVRTFRA